MVLLKCTSNHPANVREYRKDKASSTMDQPMHIVQTIASLRLSSGGTARAVSALSSALGRLSVPVELLSLGYERDAMEGTVEPTCDSVKVTTVPVAKKPLWRESGTRAFGDTLRTLCASRGHVVIHDNGIWLPTNHMAATVARESGVPLIISTHGMLEPWALRHRAWKKRLAWLLYQQRDLRLAAVLHATAQQEVESLRHLGFRQPIAMIPNGVELHAVERADRPPAPARGDANPRPTVRTALFLSRIHPKKGLIQLIDAWNSVHPVGWRLIIAGPDEGGHQALIEAKVREAGLTDAVEFRGAVEGEAKAELYMSSDLFILPTFSENFGIVVAEALACGIPVITTRGAPWGGIIEHRCGWWVDPAADHIAKALREATSLQPQELRAMGDRGRIYAQQFNWNAIAKDTLSVYQWMLGQCARPACVVLD